MKRVVSLANFDHMQIYVDGSHATTHINMRGHTGGCIVMGDGVVHARSSKQGLNSKSSTETELIAASDYLPYTLWLLYFYGKQGYKIAKSELMQDNQSTMRWLKNGKRSSGKQSRHVNIRFFWVADILKAHRISVEYCSTFHMLGDFFTKPLQGLRPITDLKEKGVKLVKSENSNVVNRERGIVFPSRKERVEKCGSDEKIKRRVSFSDCGKSHNSKRNEVKNISTYAEILRNNIRASETTN